ncbi:unnamed protein product [Kuraishia capsulata CBS 1993]|uniref:Uncharacterized protein n=1 Tax=Kuraishia capsulata CBS 1993 TaxID=1382522 RepID=W6MSC7_9ASCO|nr:uncharacterized protein KUCA_T00004088001 [Kuraishia capsulata CBS 1993]CDK28107.1 unnamed protein product [Kuraishia capsulata CBS 1993]
MSILSTISAAAKKSNPLLAYSLLLFPSTVHTRLWYLIRGF